MSSPNEIDKQHLLSLIKESNMLVDDLAKMDKQMEADILKQKGALAVWWEENIESDKVASFAVDRAVDKAADHVPYVKPVEKGLKVIYEGIFKTMKWSSEMAVSAALAPFEASRQPSYKMAYLDSRFGNEYFAKKQRLEEIYRELFHQMPPSPTSLIQVERCAIENSWRKN
jgi:hypothetical protein